MKSRKRALALFAAVLLFALLAALCRLILSDAVSVEVTAQFDHRDKLQLFYGNEWEQQPFQEEYSPFSEGGT